MTNFQKVAASVVAIILVVPICIATTDQDEKPPASKEKADGSPLLAALASIPAFASAMDVALRNQGRAIDIKKAKKKLVPGVTAIQGNLSELEDVNKRVVEELSKQSSNEQKLNDELVRIRDTIFNMNFNFKSLRSSVQELSIPELTEMERSAERLMAEKGNLVNEMLEQLGYANPNTPFGAQPSHVNLRNQSKNLIDLLHQAQDAFGKLHQSLLT